MSEAVKCKKSVCVLSDGHDGECYVQPDLYQLDWNRLVGQLKTVVDAAIPGQQQSKAVKDLINLSVWNWVNQNFLRPVRAVRIGPDGEPLMMEAQNVPIQPGDDGI